MKLRLTASILLLSLLLLAAASASAAGSLRLKREVPEYARWTQAPAEDEVPVEMAEASYASCALIGPDSGETCVEYTWTILDNLGESGSGSLGGFGPNISGGEGGTDPHEYQISVAVLDNTYENPWMANTLYYPPLQSETTFSYTFYQPGSYVLFLDAYQGDSLIGGDILVVEITSGSRPNPLTAQVQQAAALCQGDSDFEPAVLAHDWLCDHVDYDYSYVYYSAEDAFFRGTCVCNGYTYAYQLLLQELGIPCQRISWDGSDTEMGHIWNTVQLEGSWYHVDVTWDDDAHYPYFGLTDELILLDHVIDYRCDGTPPCDSLDCNYFVHTGEWKSDFGYQVYSEAQELLLSGVHRMTLSAMGDPLYDTLTAWGMKVEPWQDPDTGEQLPAPQVTCSESGQTIRAVFLGNGQLLLPADLTLLEAEVFTETPARSVIIPSGCAVSGRAFSGSGVWDVYFLGDPGMVDEHAFDGTHYVCLHGGSSIQALAQRLGLDYSEE